MLSLSSPWVGGGPDKTQTSSLHLHSKREASSTGRSMQQHLMWAVLVAENSENGEILTSYTSGFVTAEKPYSEQTNARGQSSWIDSRVSVGGFVNTNDGTITDCYANLPILSDASSAGFALYNTGTIRRSFFNKQHSAWKQLDGLLFLVQPQQELLKTASTSPVTKSIKAFFEGEIAGVTKLTYNDSVENQTNEFANLSETLLILQLFTNAEL